MSSITASSIASSLQAENLYVANPGLTGDLGITYALKMMRGRPGAVILLDRTYKMQGPIILGTGQALVGLGTSTVLQYAGDPLKPAITVSSGGGLQSLKITGPGGAGIGIELKQLTSGFTIRDVTVQGFKHGAELNNCYTQIWNACRFEGNDVGIHFSGQWVMNGYFTEGHIAGNRIGVLIEGAAHLGHEFRTCIEGNTEAGIWSTGSLGNSEIHRCYFELNGQGDIILNNGYIMQVEIHSNLFAAAMQPPELTSQVGVRVNAGHYVSIHDNNFGITNPLEILPGAQDVQVGPNLFSVKPLLSQVVGGFNTRYFEGSETPPATWFDVP